MQLARNEEYSLFIKEGLPDGRVSLEFLQAIQDVVDLHLLLGGRNEALSCAHGSNLHQRWTQGDGQRVSLDPNVMMTVQMGNG